MLGRRRRGADSVRFRCFFATDIHGSDRCFRKFLAAADAYKADLLVLGGDIIGKAIVPVVRRGNIVSVRFQGSTRDIGVSELPSVLEQISVNGLYAWECDHEHLDRLRYDTQFRDQIFQEVIEEQVRSWCDLAAERLREHVVCVITPGNDDPPFVDAILSTASRIISPERRVVDIGPIALASLGNVNKTPWNTDREYAEADLADQIDEMVTSYSGAAPLVFNFHCPPFASGLDTVMKLTEDLRPAIEHGAPVEIPVGSVAIRDAIETWQPVVGLHGHIHEVTAQRKIAGTVCVNPGSEYATGALKGALVDFGSDGRYRAHMFTRG